MALGVGEALVSCLDEQGIPCVVERARILPPQSLMGAADDERVKQLILSDEFELKYRDEVDRESAYEIIMAARQELTAQQQREAENEYQRSIFIFFQCIDRFLGKLVKFFTHTASTPAPRAGFRANPGYKFPVPLPHRAVYCP